MKHLISVLILTFFLSVNPAEAQTFSVSLLEDIQGSEGAEMSNAVLNGSLDYLFSAGFIATNEAIKRVDMEWFRSSIYAIQAAQEAFVDYMALVWIRYVPCSGDPAASVPETILWRLVRIRDGYAMAEGSVPPSSYEVKSETERQGILEDLGRSLADLWAKALRKDRG